MTGAGSARIAYELETSFGTLPGAPVWVQPFENITNVQAQLTRNLTRARQPDTPKPDGSTEGNVIGNWSLSGVLTDTNFHDLLFPESTNTAMASSGALSPSATWYIESEIPGGTDQERFLSGAIVQTATWRYQQGQDVTVELSGQYADEPQVGGSHGSAPSSISQPSKSDMVRWHGTSFQISSVEVDKLQSLTLTLNTNSRLRFGQSETAIDAVIGPYEPTLTCAAILEDNDQYQLALGGSSATTTQTEVDESPGTLAFSNPNNDPLVTYNLSGLQPDVYDWADLVNPDTDITEPVDYHVKDISVA